MITDEEKQAHRAAVAARLEVVADQAHRNTTHVVQKVTGQAYQAGRFAAIEVRPDMTQAERIAELWRWADEAQAELLPHTACRKRCSHCCHIAVLVPKPEAELIAARTGHELAAHTIQRGGPHGKRTVSGRGFEDIPWGYDHPCVFLQDGQCSIYAHRPLACRTHFNFDTDELLCKLTLAPETVPVPYWDHLRSDLALVRLCGIHAQVADIREWFPKKTNSEFPVNDPL